MSISNIQKLEHQSEHQDYKLYYMPGNQEFSLLFREKFSSVQQDKGRLYIQPSIFFKAMIEHVNASDRQWLEANKKHHNYETIEKIIETFFVFLSKVKEKHMVINFSEQSSKKEALQSALLKQDYAMVESYSRVFNFEILSSNELFDLYNILLRVIKDANADDIIENILKMPFFQPIFSKIGEDSLLAFAIQYGSKKVIQLLLEAGFSNKIKSPKQIGMMNRAVDRGLEFVKLLLKFPKFWEIRYIDSLRKAIEKSNLDTFSSIFEKSSLSEDDIKEITIHAARLNQLDIFKYLMPHLSRASDCYFDVFLTFKHRDNLEMCQMLQENISILTEDREKLVCEAAKRSIPEIVQLLDPSSLSEKARGEALVLTFEQFYHKENQLDTAKILIHSGPIREEEKAQAIHLAKGYNNHIEFLNLLQSYNFACCTN